MCNLFSNSKSEKDEVYAKGYGDGRNGCLLDDIVQSIAKGVPGFDGPHQSIYDKGYEQGSIDRLAHGRLED